MKRGHQQVRFKEYHQGQAMLLPPRMEELIPEEHMVRIVNRVVEEMYISTLIKKYKGGGTSAYHPRMMLKVLVYAYVERNYSSRGIAKAMRENVNFMWLSGMNQPDHRTINGFRGERMKGAIEEVFASVVEVLVRAGHFQLENYYLDGTKIEANANKHRVVWAKRNRRHQEQIREKVREILDEVDRINEIENEQYGGDDLPEMDIGKKIDSETLKENYAYLESHQLGNFVKYNTFHREQIKHRKPELIRKKMFRSESFPYDEAQDEFICPAKQRLSYRFTRTHTSANGYQSERRV
jgi:transposase